MTTLNLHSRDPDPDPEDGTTDPETPPGLDAIRAWLRKLHPLLRGPRLWIRWILSGPPKAWRLLRKHGPRITKLLRRIAAEGTVTRRFLERLGHLLRETAVKLDAAFTAFRDPRGESRQATGDLDQLGETFRRLGERATLGARIVGIVVSALNRLADFLPEGPTATPPPPPDPRSQPKSPPQPQPQPQADPTPHPTPRPHSPPPGKSPEEPPPQPPPPDPPETDDPPPDPPETHDPPPETSTPPPHPRPTPAVSPKKAWEARVKGLPPTLHKWVRDLGERPRRKSLHALILRICHLREWTTSEELARFLNMHQSSLVQRHLSALVEAGLLELKYPDNPRHQRQAYRTRPEAAASHM